jgi:hypothetical protein
VIENTDQLGDWLFIKTVCLCYFFAFASLREQVLGLFGSRGIQPIHDFLYGMGQRAGQRPFFWIPTIFWWRSDDKFLQTVALLGCLGAALAFFNILPALILVVLWILYLSFMSVGTPFLHFQWDTLLLEVGFAAPFVALTSPTPLLIHAWLCFLVFRFILASGLVKLLARCKEWWSLNAMAYHFETQPLPNRGGFFAHLFLKSWTKPMTVLVFLFEIGVPFLFLGSPGVRSLGALLSILFQIAIIATGNFAFFNLLTIALCFPLISDQYLGWLKPLYSSMGYLEPSLFLTVVLNAVGGVMLLLNGIAFVRQFVQLNWLPDQYFHLTRFYITNTYGLFARMTTVRNEVILEGSEDGTVWKEYAFKYKPGALNAPPLQIAPFHPRLDWQLWFSALTPSPRDPWWHAFMMRLLQGSKDVEALLKENPFPDKPPAFLRAHLYRYRFNTFKDWKKSGNYWVRTYVGTYMKPISSAI